MAGVALFDMDRTLVRKDTAGLYIRYEAEIGRASKVALLRVIYWQLIYRLGLLDIQSVAGRALTWYRGRSEAELRAEIVDFFRERVVQHIGAAAREAVRSHLAAGDLVAIASGASRYACEPVAKELGIEHIVCTELETSAGMLTGKTSSVYCYGAGKLALACAFLETHGRAVGEATVYSDSVADLPLLTAARIAVAVNPDPRLSRHARSRAWRIEHW